MNEILNDVKASLERENNKKFSNIRNLSENILILDNEYFIKSFDSSEKKTSEFLGIIKLEDVLKSLKTSLKTPYIFKDGDKFIVYGFVASERNSFSEGSFAEQLKDLHDQTVKSFGFETDNFIGEGIQENSISDDWGSFFYEYRLIPIVKRSKNSNWDEVIAKNKNKIINILNEHKPLPSPVHGDLWSGNVIFSGDENYLIDPSFYYGDREVDLAMSDLFGGFGKTFYERYFSLYKRDSKFEIRKIIYNLYHLINHYNIFGETYHGPIDRSLKHLNFY